MPWGRAGQDARRFLKNALLFLQLFRYELTRSSVTLHTLRWATMPDSAAVLADCHHYHFSGARVVILGCCRVAAGLLQGSCSEAAMARQTKTVVAWHPRLNNDPAQIWFRKQLW